MKPKDYIKGSDGNGEAVRAIIVEPREIGDMSLIVDSVLNWPHRFVATSGVLDEVTGLIDKDTMSVFYGHLDGSIIMIESFAPGYYDVGHDVNEVLILKPSTAWADKVYEAVDDVAAITVSNDEPVEPEDGDFWLDEDAPTADMAAIAAEVGKYLFPIGSYYTNETDATNPATLLGFGTWAAVENRFIYGKGTKAAGVTGGAETHVLTNSEMPVHSFNLSDHGDEGGSTMRTFSGTGGTVGGTWVGTYRPPAAAAGGAGSYYNPSISWGANAAHNNMPPYIVAYIWKRTA